MLCMFHYNKKKHLLNSAIGKLLSVVGITCTCESTFSTVNFMESEYRLSISD